jgi:hypothetical protein
MDYGKEKSCQISFSFYNGSIAAGFRNSSSQCGFFTLAGTVFDVYADQHGQRHVISRIRESGAKDVHVFNF